MSRKEEKDTTGEKQEVSNARHLKWPAIIMLILIVVLIVCLDQCYRSGEL